jgi:hypothetical protein
LSSSKAVDLLSKSHADLIVIDWDGENSSALLREIWASEAKPKPTIMAVSANSRPIPGAHVVLRKPVTNQGIAQSLKTAYSQMLLDHRRHVRYALMTPVMATHRSRETIPLTVTDIGDGGVGLKVKQSIAVGDELSFRLQLPGARKEIYVQVRVVWTREHSAAGCEFLAIPPVDVDALHEWLMGRSRIKRPRVGVFRPKAVMSFEQQE